VKLLALVSAALVAAFPAATARHVGPGPLDTALTSGRFHVLLHLAPNVATRAGSVSVSVRTGDGPVIGAHVRLTVTMVSMNMGSFTLPLAERSAGTYSRAFPVLGMGGRWRFTVHVLPSGGSPFSVSVADRMPR